MPAPSNLSFEVTDATPGSALGWSLTVTSSAETIADFDAATRPFEQFDGWQTFSFAFIGPPPAVGADLLQPNFTTLHASPKHVEDFEELWLANQTAIFILDSPIAAAFQGPVLGYGHRGLIAPVVIPDPAASALVTVVCASPSSDVVKVIANLGIVDATGDFELLSLKLRTPAAAVDSTINLAAVEATFGNPFPTHVDINITLDIVPIDGTANGVWTFKYRDTEAAGTRTFEDITIRLYGAPVLFEDFNSGWSNDFFVDAIADWIDGTYGLQADLDPGAGKAETFETWGTLLDEWSDVSGTSVVATFYNVATLSMLAGERFESVRPPLAYTIDLVNSEFNITAHGMSNDDLVQLAGAGTLPEPFMRETDYYVVDTTLDTFRLAATIGGPPFTIDRAGSGTIRVMRNPHLFWNTTMTTM